jgi:hypothetical protein
MHMIATWTYESDSEHCFWCEKPGEGEHDHGQGGFDDSKCQPDDEGGEADQFYEDVHCFAPGGCVWRMSYWGRSTRHAE